MSENKSKAAWHVVNSKFGLKQNYNIDFENIKFNDKDIFNGSKIASKFN